MEVGPNYYSAFSAELSDGFVSESSNPDPGAIHTDAFTINWAPLRGYASPPPLPFNLILMSKTLTKVTIDQTELILVAPVWQALPCWPVPLRLLISQPLLLPISPTLFTDPTDLNRVHPMYPRLHMAVLHISTNASTLRAFQQTLPIYSSQQLVSPHTKPTSLVGTVGAAGILDKTDPLSSSISDILIYLQKS